MPVADFVKKIVEDVCGETKMRVGARLTHPDGRTVEITSGQFWGEHGVSNFWYWREVLSDGSLSEKEEHGYGWC